MNLTADMRDRITAVLADDRERTIGDLKRAMHSTDEGAIRAAIISMAMAGKIQISRLYGIPLYRKAAK